MKNKLLFASALFAAVFFVGCDGNNPSNGKGEKHTSSGMYVGITGFSDNVTYYPGQTHRYEILTKSNASNYTSFIRSLSPGDATVLYYAVDNNLSYLENSSFPSDLSSVNIVTFTDGLDQGSRALDKQDGNNSYSANGQDYVNAINEKINRIKIQGLPINAYAIGVRGGDVKGDAVETFRNNLEKLSSDRSNAFEVNNMDEVSAKFKEIAASLYKKNESTTLIITIPMPNENEMERFTFDNVSAAETSKCYIEGVYANDALTNVKYVGCMSNSGTTIKQTSAGGVKIRFEFENFTDDKGNAIKTDKMQQWHKEAGQTTWIHNEEFKPSESIQESEERKSAVIVLILDCSSSLGSDFAKVKTAASDFINTLANGVGDIPGGGPESEEEDKAQVRFYKEKAYDYVMYMGLDVIVNDEYSDEKSVWYEFGTAAGTSGYFEIPAGSHYPWWGYETSSGEVELYYCLDDEPYTYNFAANKKYTIVSSDDGQYLVFSITLDGSFNAPAKVVVQKRILKSDMGSLIRLRK